MSAAALEPLTAEQIEAIMHEANTNVTVYRKVRRVLKQLGTGRAYNDPARGAMTIYHIPMEPVSVQWAVWNAVFDSNRE
jgi:hypothetical protein